MKNFKVLNWLKWISVFIIFMIVIYVISTFNTPILDDLTGEVATRYMEMPSGIYAGDTILNTITGQGSFYFDTGEIYKGAWKENEMNGKGKFTYTTGVYEGDFSNSKRNGQGTFTWQDGATYTGEWSSDKLSGNGSLKQGQATYQGTFVENKFKDGTITLATNVGNYKLTAVDGVLSDQIEVTFASGITYKGGYKANTISGNGTMTYPGTGKYEGSFSDGKEMVKANLLGKTV